MSRNVVEESIFIHSAFRAGSTYVFNVFRRSQEKYWCYQEPLHEIAFYCRNDPAGMAADQGDEKQRLLRHPKIGDGYFKELQEVWPVWKDAISEDVVYDAYFSAGEEDFGQKYWRALAGAANGRPVFQECRTAGRIGAIRKSLGGTHLFLWRNPWDQWWSYKVASYFEIASNLMIRARHAPAAARRLIEILELPSYESSDIGGAFSFYGERPTTSEQSYQLFYMLWCLGMREGLHQADLLWSIDRLSDSFEYRLEVQSKLAALGIVGIDFSDCMIPQGQYSETERTWFAAQESKVHALLLEDDWLATDVQHVQEVRQQFQPLSWSAPVVTLEAVGLSEQASRGRELAKRYETTLANRVRTDTLRYAEKEAGEARAVHEARNAEQATNQAIENLAQVTDELKQAREAVQYAQSMGQLAEERVAQIEAVLEQTKATLVEAQLDARISQARYNEYKTLAEARLHQADLHLAKMESRVALADAHVTQLETALTQAKASLVEAQTDAQVSKARYEERAKLSEARAQEAESRASQSDSRAVYAEARICQIEGVLELTRANLIEARTDANTLLARYEEHGSLVEGRLLQAEARALLSESKTIQAETLLAETKAELDRLYAKILLLEESRNQDKVHFAQAELRALNAESRLELSDARIKNAESLARRFESDMASLKTDIEVERKRADASDAQRAEESVRTQEKQSEVDYWHGRLLDVHRSTSWKITKPMRFVKRVLTGERLNVRLAGVVPNASRYLLQPCKTVLAHSIRYVFIRPRARQMLSWALKRIPSLHTLLRNFAFKYGAVASPGLSNKASARVAETIFVRRVEAAAEHARGMEMTPDIFRDSERFEDATHSLDSAAIGRVRTLLQSAKVSK